MREIFGVMLVFCELTDALSLWEKYKKNLPEDIRYQIYRGEGGEHALDEVYNSCLTKIEDSVLSLGGLSLTEYGYPQADRSRGIFEKIQYLRETNYDINALSSTVSNGEASLKKRTTRCLPKHFR